MELIEQIKKDLKDILSEKRYTHSIGVMEMAAKLAEIYGADVETAKLAGILHDIAKEMSSEEKLKYVKENNIIINEVERINTPILHGKIGADIAKKKYGINEQVQRAIEYHTTTNPNMDLISKIVYVSDKIELNRKSEDYDIKYERELALKDIDKTIIYIIHSNIKSLLNKRKLIEAEMIETRNKLLIEQIKSKLL